MEARLGPSRRGRRYPRQRSVASTSQVLAGRHARRWCIRPEVSEFHRGRASAQSQRRAPLSPNPLVDFYNLVSLTHVVPTGGFDLAEVGSELRLRLTRDGDLFTALDEPAPLEVGAGEVAYAAGTTVLTRHFVWRQARTGLINSDN